MLRTLILAFFVSYGLAFSAQSAVTGGHAAAVRLQGMLDTIDAVSFYFLTRTGEYSFDRKRFKKESTIRVYRSCGNNCRRFMREVITHLSGAAEAECLPGQQNVLIEVGDIEAILYSYSGRMIEFQGKCYFSEEGIDTTVRRTEFLFD